ncbi:MAG: hypothetical protein HYY46_24585 [Deltaproteobacteria bacterium]|nr:hypothetical protein [Deltaproteobacteria bacterium]
MATVTLILGYCCSGKTYLADQMVKTLGVRKFEEGFLNDTARHAQLNEALRNNIDCVVVEIEYCLEKPRQSIVEKLKREVPGLTVQLEFFEANLHKANENCRRENHKGDPEGHIWINTHRIGSGYKIPPGVIPREIFEIPESGAN